MKCLEPFPVIKKRTAQKVINEQQCAIYCTCILYSIFSAGELLRARGRIWSEILSTRSCFQAVH